MLPKEFITCEICYGRGLRITINKWSNEYGVAPCWLCNGSGKMGKISEEKFDLGELKGIAKVSGTSITIMHEESSDAT